jgi:hypothetical protein
MGDVAAVLDTLNAREEAAVAWLVLIVAFGAYKGGRDVTSSFAAVVRDLLQWKLQALFVSAALYCTVLVALAARFGLWHRTSAKETVYWFFTGGTVLVGRAVSHAAPSDPHFYARLLRDAVRFTVVIEFLVNLYVFPFPVELALFPFILTLVVMQVVVASSDEYTAVRGLVDGATSAIGILLIIYVTIRFVSDPSGAVGRDSIEGLLIAPVLTAAFIPLLCAWAWVSRREQRRLRESFARRSGSAY